MTTPTAHKGHKHMAHGKNGSPLNDAISGDIAAIKEKGAQADAHSRTMDDNLKKLNLIHDCATLMTNQLNKYYEDTGDIPGKNPVITQKGQMYREFLNNPNIGCPAKPDWPINKPLSLEADNQSFPKLHPEIKLAQEGGAPLSAALKKSFVLQVA